MQGQPKPILIGFSGFFLGSLYALFMSTLERGVDARLLDHLILLAGCAFGIFGLKHLGQKSFGKATGVLNVISNQGAKSNLALFLKSVAFGLCAILIVSVTLFAIFMLVVDRFTF